MSDIDCPYCEHEHEACGSHEDDEGEWQCHKCEKFFDVEIEYSANYYTSKKLCTTEHQWGEWGRWFPAAYEEATEIRGNTCKNCDKVKVESREVPHEN